MEFPKIETQPVAAATAIIQGSTYRISVLTERLLRLEYNETGHFEDRASQVVWNRAFPKVEFEVNETEEELELETSFLHLHYDKKEFSANGLTIEVKGYGKDQARSWFFGKDPEHSGNLFGTARTLDMVNGSCELGLGLMSLEGWSVLDDSNTLLLDENGWVCPRTEKGLDFYFFGYQSDEKGCLRDYYHLTGKTPMLPRFALGNWWSRYYEYSEESYLKLMKRFEKENVPFSVAVIDMDWHKVQIDPKYGSGWTGFSWNRELFPDPKRFIDALHEKGMRVTLNLHPADGIRGFEDCYEGAAKAMGVSAEKEEPVPFDVTDEKALKIYFEYGCYPHEELGVDFWWIDWQQGTRTKIEGLDSLWMLNHFHFLDSGKKKKRPMTFSRYAGPGSHRYPIGFSGDSFITWETLDFQPYFTSTASNIGYGWWSHDIGGHNFGYRDDELECRWYQLGVFSPIMRLHSTKNEFNGKEPWQYRRDICEIMENFLRLRHKLIPYLYTMNHRAFAEDLPLILPLHYEHSWRNAFGKVKNEYYYGTEMLVNPITAPMAENLNMGKASTWLPKGIFIDFFTGVVYQSEERTFDMYRPLDSIPVLVKAGGIVPMTEEIDSKEAAANPEKLYLRIFSGADGSFTLYEDDNETTAYQNGDCALTEYTLNWEKEKKFTISAVRGRKELIPEKRSYTVEWNALELPEDAAVQVSVNGVPCDLPYRYLAEEGKLIIELPAITAEDEIQIRLPEETSLYRNQTKRHIFEILKSAQIEFDLKTAVYEVICKDTTILEKISELQGMNLDHDHQGAIMELLTAQAE